MRAEEAHNFRLLGHDPSAAWGGGSLVEVSKGFAYVGAVAGNREKTHGFTVHDVRDPTKPKKVFEFGQEGQDRARAASDVGHGCAGRDACGRPVAGLVGRGHLGLGLVRLISFQYLMLAVTKESW